MLRCKLSHLARTEDQGIGLVKLAQFLTRQLHCGIAYRYRVELDASLSAHPLARSDCPVKERIEHRAGRSFFAPHRIRILDLRQDLPFPQHE